MPETVTLTYHASAATVKEILCLSAVG
jgi:hypothetical protein